MSKNGFPRTFRYPSADLRDQVRAAVKERGFRTEQAFLIAACEHELQKGDNTEAIDDPRKRSQGRASTLHSVHTQVTRTNSLLQYVLTSVAEPPEEILPAAHARAKLRYPKILHLAGQEVVTRNQATLEEVLSHGKQQ